MNPDTSSIPNGTGGSACPICGHSIPPHAPFHQCPKCLFGLAVNPLGETADEAGPGEAASLHRFGDYELERQIGRGGMGVVYAATQISLRRPVAIKMILETHTSSASARRRFTIEAEAAAKLDHPNIVPIYEVGEHEDQPFLSMKLVQGDSLKKRMERGEYLLQPAAQGNSRSGLRQRQSAIARLMVSLARAVHHAHLHGVLHRDLKPANILIDNSGQPFLTDFGLAKILEPAGLAGDEVAMTSIGTALGTPSYMSPEQANGQSLSQATDIYSLGTIFYELLTGTPPFKAPTPLEIMRQVAEQEPTHPRAVNPNADTDLATICMKCLEKQPEARYASAEELAQDLERWLKGEPIRARRAGALLQVSRWIQRNPVGAGLIASLLAGLTVALGLLHLALERQTRLDLHRAHNIDLFSEEVEALWRDPQKTHVTVFSSQLAALADHSPSPTGPDTLKLTLALSVNEDPLGRAMRYAPFLGEVESRMKKMLGRPVLFDLRLYKLSGAEVQPIAQHEVDLQRLNPIAFLRAQQTAPGAQVVVQEIAAKEAVIFARQGSGIRTMRDVAGHRVAFAHTNSIISFWAKVHLARLGIRANQLEGYQHLDSLALFLASNAPPAEIETDVEVYAHRAVIQEVLANKFDVGEASRRHFEMNKRKPPGLLELYAFPVTADVLVARPGLPGDVVQSLRRTLLSFHGKSDQAMLRRLHSTTITGFTEPREAEFAELHAALTNEVLRFENAPARPNSSARTN